MPTPASHDASASPGTWALQLTVLAWVIVLNVILARAILQPQQHSVYPIFANAGREWLAGIDLYDRSLPRGDLDKFRYAPIVAVCFAPLAALPDVVGGVLWRIINTGVFLGGFIAFATTVFPRTHRLTAWGIVLLAWALLPLSVGSLNNSQPNSLVVGCLLFAVAAIVQQRWNLAALCLAIPVLFKVYPLAVVLLFFLIHPVRLSWRTGLAIAAGLVLPFALQNPAHVAQMYQSWVHQVSVDNRREYPLELSYRDAHTLTRVAGFPMDDGSYALLQLATALLLAVVVLRGHLQAWTPAQHLRTAFDLGSCWMIVFGPATENCTYALVAPTLALAVWEAFQVGQPVWKRMAMVGIVSAFVVAALASALAPFGRTWSAALMPIGALLLFAERLAGVGARTRRLASPIVQSQALAQAA